MAYYPFATELGARYTLVGPDNTMAVFNDPADPNYVGMLTEVVGLDSPDVRESATEQVEGDGGSHGTFYYGRRPISMNGRVFGHSSVAERRKRLDLARRAANAMRADATLSWVPGVRADNFVLNPSFELGVTNYTTTVATGFASSTLGPSTVWASSGTQSYRVQATMPADTTARVIAVLQSSVAYMTVRPGHTYTASADLNITDVPATGIAVSINWYKADKSASTVQAQSIQPYNASAAARRQSFTAVAPSDAAYAAIRVHSSTNVSGDAQDWYVDNLRFTEGTDATYFDGNTAGYYWQGDANSTASGDYIEMFTPVRRQQPFRESGAWVKDFQIPLVSAYAYIYSAKLKTATPGTAAENRGSAPAYPIVSVTGPSSATSVSDGTRTFNTTGLTGGSALAAGETMQIDMLNHTAKFTAGARNGQSANRFIDYVATTWPYLAGAGTTTTFTLGGGGSATIQYRDTWI